MTTDLTALWHTNRRWRAWMDANTKFVTPDTLDCLRYARIEANEAADCEMRIRLTGHARNNGREHTIEQELADVAMLALTALPEPMEIPDWMQEDEEEDEEFDVDDLCSAANTAVMMCKWDMPWSVYVCKVIYHVLTYPGLDLAAELDRCWRRLADKHGWDAWAEWAGVKTYSDRIKFHAGLLGDPMSVPAPWTVEQPE